LAPQEENRMYDETRQYLAKLGYPPGDLFDLPTSSLRFPDGAQFRIEVPTVNNADAVKVIVKMARECGIVVNRIDQTHGVMRFTDKEHQDYLDLGREYGIEMFFGMGPRGLYDIGGQKLANSVWAHQSAYRLRGMDQVVYAIEDMKRIVRLGARGLLISDEGLLLLAHQMRQDGTLPGDVVLMASAHMGHNNPVDYRILQNLGADTIASQRDLELPMIAALRASVRVPIHVHVDNPEATGGFVRTYDAPDMVRVGAPIYLKTGSSVLAKHGARITEDEGLRMVQQAVTTIEVLRRHYPEAVQTQQPVKGMAIPV
jgi:hypothetical protein